MSLFPLIGHTTLRSRLDAEVVRGALPASILLQGPPGIGKQQLALWLGRRLLCTAEGSPCGQCQHCKYALDGVHPDLRWYFPRPRLKEGSNIALDDVAREYAEAIADRSEADGIYPRADGSQGIYVYVSRLIVQQAVKTPALAARKVFVVGEADRMVPQTGSAEAANAFLKLLEEPPADTTIILTSSEPGALLPTIRSRVVSIRVAPLSDADVRTFLTRPAAADAAGKGATMDELVRLAHGAPGTLIGAANRGAALDRARTMLAAARGSREQRMRAAFVQGSSKARGAFSDVLEAMTVLLHENARAASTAGDEVRAVAAAKAIRLVEDAKRSAEGNAIPQLVTAHLLRELAAVGA